METATPIQWIVTIALIAGTLYWVWPRTEEWTGVLYPDRGNLIQFETLGAFETLEACRVAANERMLDLEDPAAADWECGLNCETIEGTKDQMICAKTER